MCSAICKCVGAWSWHTSISMDMISSKSQHIVVYVDARDAGAPHVRLGWLMKRTCYCFRNLRAHKPHM